MSDDTPVVEPTSNPAMSVPDASATPEELNANIDKVLGLEPTKEVAVEEETTDPVSTDIPEESAPDAAEEAGEAGDDPSGSDEEDTDEPEEVATDPTVPGLEVQDIDGKTYKITRVEDLPDNFVPKNNRQVIEILRDLTRLDASNEKLQQDAAAREQAQQVEAQRQEVLKSWDNEIADLQKDGRLDKPKAQAGSDGFTKDPAVQKVDAVFKFMAEINDKRAAAGNPNMIRSFEDALDKYDLQESTKVKEEATKSEVATAKEKAGVIGKGAGVAGGSEGVYVAGSAKSIYDL